MFAFSLTSSFLQAVFHRPRRWSRIIYGIAERFLRNICSTLLVVGCRIIIFSANVIIRGFDAGLQERGFDRELLPRWCCGRGS